MNKIIPAFDGLRALGTIGIFLFHSGFLLEGTFPVTWFFMLSGFLLYYTKYNSTEYSTFKIWMSSYVTKKWKEFYPLHILTFFIACLVMKRHELTFEVLKSAILNLLLLHPFFKKYVFSFNGLSWYLAVTIFLYIVGYFLLIILMHLKNISFHVLLTLSIITILNLMTRSGISLYLYTNPMYRILDFWLGMLVGKAYVEQVICLEGSKIELGIVVVFVIQYIISLLIGSTPGYYSIIFTIALYVFACGKGIISQILSRKLFRIIAYYSFEFYMFHELTLRIFRKVFLDEKIFYPLKLLLIAVPALIVSIIVSVSYKKLVDIRYKVNK